MQFHQLSGKWTLSEKYNASQGIEYKQTIAEVCQFNTVEELAFIMRDTIYSRVSQLFSEPYKYKLFKHLSKDLDVQIEAIQLFKNDISPWWEDTTNKGEIQFEVSTKYINIYDQLYKDVLLEMIGQSNNYSRHINGLRVVDKINLRTDFQFIRFELWLDIDPKESQEIIELENVLIGYAQKYGIEKINFKHVSHQV